MIALHLAFWKQCVWHDLCSMVVVVVQPVSHVSLFSTPWTAACQATLSFTIFLSLLTLLMPTELVIPSNYLIPCCPLLLLPSIFPRKEVISNESPLHIWWPKYWSFCINHSNEYSGLISFRIDWFDLLGVQGTLESSPAWQFESISSSALILLYGPTLTSIHDYWKSHNFSIQTFVGKPMSAFYYAV